MYNTKSIHTKN